MGDAFGVLAIIKGQIPSVATASWGDIDKHITV